MVLLSTLFTRGGKEKGVAVLGHPFFFESALLKVTSM
jgi:hypothetical protein